MTRYADIDESLDATVDRWRYTERAYSVKCRSCGDKMTASEATLRTLGWILDRTGEVCPRCSDTCTSCGMPSENRLCTACEKVYTGNRRRKLAENKGESR